MKDNFDRMLVLVAVFAAMNFAIGALGFPAPVVVTVWIAAGLWLVVFALDYWGRR